MQTAITIVGGVIGASLGQPQLGLTLGAILGSYLYPPESQAEKMHVGGLQFSAPQKGAVLPILYGCNKLSGTIIWYGAFETHAADSGGSGGGSKGTGQDTYTVGLAIALCEGRASSLLGIWAGGDEVDLDSITYDPEFGLPTQTPNAYISGNLSSSWLSAQIYAATDLVHCAGAVRIGLANDDPVEFKLTAGGVTAGVTYYVKNLADEDFQVSLAPGGLAVNLTPNAYNMVSRSPVVVQADVAYPGVAYVVLHSYPLGYTTSLPSFTFEVQRTTADVMADNPAIAALSLDDWPEDGNGDMNPVVCLADLLTHPRYGLGLASTDLDQASFYEEASYCSWAGFYCSPLLDSMQPGTSHIEHLLSYFDGMLVYHQGKFKLHSRRSPSRENLPYTQIQPWEWLDGYVPKYSRASDRQIANTVTVEYVDREDSYNSGVVERRDDWDIGRRGIYREQLSLNGLTTPVLAEKMTSKLLWARITGPASAEWGMGPAGIWHEPGKLVSFEQIGASAYALEGSVYRIVKITEQPDGTFVFAGVEER